MGGPTDTDITALEALLRSYGNAHGPRRMSSGVFRGRMSGVRALAAACTAIFVFAPSSAVTTILLMTTDSVGLALSPPVSDSHALLKSDRLPLPDNVPSALQQSDVKDFVHVVVTTTERPLRVHTTGDDAEIQMPLLIRGRLEDEQSAIAADNAPSEMSAPSPSKRHRLLPRSKPPLRITAEVVPPETKSPSLLEGLFGLRSL